MPSVEEEIRDFIMNEIMTNPPSRALGIDDFDLDRLATAAELRRDVGLGADASIRTRAPPVREHVVGEGLVVGHHVQEVVDRRRGKGHVGGRTYRSHVPNGTVAKGG